MQISVNRVPNGYNTITGAQMAARYDKTTQYQEQIKVENLADVKELGKLGMFVTNDALYGMRQHIQRVAFDHAISLEQGLANDAALPAPYSMTNAGIPIQFLQTILPGLVATIYPARKIDEIVGVTNIGRWEDEVIAQGTVDYGGGARPYMDHTNSPLVNVNLGFNAATVMRFELAMEVLRLEDARAAAVGISMANEKRRAVTIGLDIIRNAIGFRGFNDGAGGTYGLFNAPGQPAYIPVPPGAGTGSPTQWSGKTPTEQSLDIQMAIRKLRLQTGDNIDLKRESITLAVATDAVDFLSTPNEYGYSTLQWLGETYPNIRIVSAPELNGANGGQNVAYLFIDAEPLDSTDNGRTFAHINPARMVLMGVEPEIKGYGEGYTNATAGVMVKRQLFIVRLTGI